MEASEVIKAIQAKKESMGMTNQQLSDVSGVPKSTIDRILRGDTPNPSMQSILDMAEAVGYQLGNPLYSTALSEDKWLNESSKYIVRMYEEYIASLKAQYTKLLAEKCRWINRLFFLCLALVVLVVCILFSVRYF